MDKKIDIVILRSDNNKCIMHRGLANIENYKRSLQDFGKLLNCSVNSVGCQLLQKNENSYYDVWYNKRLLLDIGHVVPTLIIPTKDNKRILLSTDLIITKSIDVANNDERKFINLDKADWKILELIINKQLLIINDLNNKKLLKSADIERAYDQEIYEDII